LSWKVGGVVEQQKKLDRRERRTRQLLSEALMALIQEKHYEAITVQDIIDQDEIFQRLVMPGVRAAMGEGSRGPETARFVGQSAAGNEGPEDVVGTDVSNARTSKLLPSMAELNEAAPADRKGQRQLPS
jgi:hypothetical protein